MHSFNCVEGAHDFGELGKYRHARQAQRGEGETGVNPGTSIPPMKQINGSYYRFVGGFLVPPIIIIQL